MIATIAVAWSWLTVGYGLAFLTLSVPRLQANRGTIHLAMLLVQIAIAAALIKARSAT
jgi:hypothetical protein